MSESKETTLEGSAPSPTQAQDPVPSKQPPKNPFADVPRFTRRAAMAGLVISVVSLLLSGTSVWLTARTFYVAQRPYIGIVEHNFKLLGDPPAGMAWAFVLSNVGNRPAWLTVDEHRTTVLREGAATDLALIGPPGGGMLLMPGQKAPLTGQFLDANQGVRVQEILSGAAQLSSTIRLSYSTESPFFGRRHFHYRAVSRFRHNTIPPAFIMVEGDGN